MSKLGLRLLDRLTDAAPSIAPRLFHELFFGLTGSKAYYRMQLARHRKKLAASHDFSKILIVPDLNIGDSIVLQPAIRCIQRHFPQSEIHYLCNRLGAELLAAMPGVTVHAVFQGHEGMPTEQDLQQFGAILAREDFTLTLNLCPFLPQRALKNSGVVLPLYLPFGCYVVRGWSLGRVTHISEFLRDFMEMFFSRGPIQEPCNPSSSQHAPSVSSTIATTVRWPTLGPGLELPVVTHPLTNDGNVIYLHEECIQRAQNFIENSNLNHAEGLVFLNPDATSQYGRMPFAIQRDLLEQIARMDEVGGILIGAAYASEGIEHAIISQLPYDLRGRIHIVPHVAIETYAAIIDACDVFISSDGGPLHLSATRKFTNAGVPMRNKTLIVTVHGATDSRMYGYDSSAANHLEANQDAPSIVFSANAPCRNITCINKWGKSCKDVRCFDGLEAASITSYIQSYLQHVHEVRTDSTFGLVGVV